MNFSICEGCGCKTSRLILCDDCANPLLKLSRELNKASKPVKETKVAVKTPSNGGTITLYLLTSGVYTVKNIEGTLRIDRKVVTNRCYFESSINLSGTFSHTALKALVKSKTVKLVRMGE